jgi:hypothetical protein
MSRQGRVTITNSMFPKMQAVPSGLRSILLNPDLQMQDLVDQVNNEVPMPTEPITKIRIRGMKSRHSRGESPIPR